MTKRLLAIDQSSKCSGWAIYEDGQLEKYDKFNFTDADIIDRLIKIKMEVEQLIEDESITHVAIEDIQLQATTRNVVTFKALAFVMAIILLLCKENDIPCEVIPSSTWKSACGVKGQARADQKRDAQRFVEEEFGIKAIQDIVDAICLGYSVSKKDKNRIDWK